MLLTKNRKKIFILIEVELGEFMINYDNVVSISEAAELLKVGDDAIHEMLAKGVIKRIGTGKKIKIDKSSINNWITNLKPKDEEYLALKRVICHFQDFFKPEYIYMDFATENKYDAIEKMSKRAKDLRIVKDHRWLYEIVVAREELVSTAVGKGIALLHPRNMHPTKISAPTVLFGRSEAGVEFDAFDHKPVNIFFLLLLHTDKQHLFSLSFITKFIMHPENIKVLNEANNPEAIYKALTYFEGKSK